MNYAHWHQYFLHNQDHFDDIDWQGRDAMNEADKRAVWHSLQQFQKGEHSEGKHLFSFAKTFPDPLYLACIRLFIREEQKHARVLGKFMEQHGIPKIQAHWVDTVFKKLRKLAGLENTLIVLVTAEIIAKVYYKALHQATDSVLLKKICSQILEDEEQHLAFQAHTLQHLYQSSNRFRQILTRSWHRLLMTGTIFVVWFGHRKALKKGSYFFSRFFMETMLVYFEVEAQIKTNAALAVEKA